MTRQAFLTLLEEIVEEPAGSLSGSEKLMEQLAGWNSLAVVSFIGMVDEQLGVTLSPQAIADCKTVNDLIALLGGRVSN